MELNPSYDRQFSENTEKDGDQLAAIEDVLILTPQSITDGIVSPQREEELDNNAIDSSSTRSPQTDLKKNQKTKDSQAFKEACETREDGSRIQLEQPSSRSSLGLDILKPQIIVRSENQTPYKDPHTTLSITKLSEPTAGNKPVFSVSSDIVSHEEIQFSVEK